MKTFNQVNEDSSDCADELVNIKADIIELWNNRIFREKIYQKNRTQLNKLYFEITSALETVIEKMYDDE